MRDEEINMLVGELTVCSSLFFFLLQVSLFDVFGGLLGSSRLIDVG